MTGKIFAASVAKGDEVRAAAFSKRARQDAMKHVAQDIPRPEDYARYMPLDHAEALMRARPGSEGEWISKGPLLADMRRAGLIGYGCDFLTAFGLAVRRVLLREDS